MRLSSSIRTVTESRLYATRLRHRKDAMKKRVDEMRRKNPVSERGGMTDETTSTAS
jgi:hypothetical protein